MARLLRTCALVLAAALAAWLVLRYGGRAKAALDSWRYEGSDPSSPLHRSMRKAIDEARYAEFLARHRRVEGLLEKAEREGASVAELHARMADILDLARRGQVPLARARLNALELGAERERR